MSEATVHAADALDDLPRIPLGDWLETAFDWSTDTFGLVFDAVGAAVETSVEGLTDALLAVPALVLSLVFALLGLLARSAAFAVGSALGFALVVSMGLWPEAMETLALVGFAAAVAALVAVPVGILAARHDRVSALLRPVLDFMQTMPAFVYLVPAVTLFSIGLVPGVVTTIVFALPPGVRLTELGIRQVDVETVEAGRAFGSSPGQILRGIQLPLARPTILAGINQVIMLALSMSVIAGIVGAGGLGQAVVTSISRLDLALGFEAGISVVVLAIWLDRLTAALGAGGSRLRLPRRGGQTTADAELTTAPGRA
ncbi:ABC transporter permease subunit [Klenkia sp. LSe6-5]|uniref:ABC transporter permease subunit n=1 Tax=Klenkia sesuvii TaxID=3103137 RepID=A0ABU8DX77_9ACTN